MVLTTMLLTVLLWLFTWAEEHVHDFFFFHREGKSAAEEDHG